MRSEPTPQVAASAPPGRGHMARTVHILVILPNVAAGLDRIRLIQPNMT